jgi:general secretion pathway protein A
MYTKHFGLKILPFENVPDPMFFFDQGDYARLRNRITDSLKAGRGLIVVTGPIGSGKTTLSQMIISDFSNDIRLIWTAEPPESSLGLFLFIAQELALKPSISERVFVIRDIRDALFKIKSEGSKCLMIIDESHLMAGDILSGIRLLNNLEEGSTKLIQILLLGQKELMETINRPEMEPFKQRIATLEIIGKMNADRIREYISHRIKVAGGHPSIFADTGLEAVVIASGSGGVPRIINSLCNRSLIVAFEREKTIVDVYDVCEAADEMGLGKDVFHYMHEVKQRESKKQVLSTMENDSIKEPEKLSKESIHSFSKESDGTNMELKNRQSETVKSIQPGSEIGIALSKIEREKNQKGLKIPVLFLLLSMIALILSIFLYYQRSGFPEPTTFIQELIDF